MRNMLFAAGGRGLGQLVSWLIRVVIYDICITTISDVFGVPRLVALFIFLGLLAAVSFGAYVFKQKYSSGLESE
ncbi:MAG TPA: hypothetical protein VG713_11660 [Pirellulales bacterium]|nr:hypothetical protein [Pirellulales bacterium]